MENGYLQTAEKLQQEAGIASSKFEVVENISLLRILQVKLRSIRIGKRHGMHLIRNLRTLRKSNSARRSSLFVGLITKIRIRLKY